MQHTAGDSTPFYGDKMTKKSAVTVFCILTFCGASFLEASGVVFNDIRFCCDPTLFSKNELHGGFEKFLLNLNSEKLFPAESEMNSCNSIQYLKEESRGELAFSIKDDPETSTEIKSAIAREKLRRIVGWGVLVPGVSLLAFATYCLVVASNTRDGGQQGFALSMGIMTGIPGIIFSCIGLAKIQKASERISQYKKNLLLTLSYRQPEGAFCVGFLIVL